MNVSLEHLHSCQDVSMPNLQIQPSRSSPCSKALQPLLRQVSLGLGVKLEELPVGWDRDTVKKSVALGPVAVSPRPGLSQ